MCCHFDIELIVIGYLLGVCLTVGLLNWMKTNYLVAYKQVISIYYDHWIVNVLFNLLIFRCLFLVTVVIHHHFTSCLLSWIKYSNPLLSCVDVAFRTKLLYTWRISLAASKCGAATIRSKHHRLFCHRNEAQLRSSFYSSFVL